MAVFIFEEEVEHIFITSYVKIKINKGNLMGRNNFFRNTFKMIVSLKNKQTIKKTTPHPKYKKEKMIQ